MRRTSIIGILAGLIGTFTVAAPLDAARDTHDFDGGESAFFTEPRDLTPGAPGELIRFQPWTDGWGRATPELYRMLFWSTVTVIGEPSDLADPECSMRPLVYSGPGGVPTSIDEVRCERPIITSGIVRIPSATPPPGGYPTLAFAHGTLGVIDRCGPSRSGVGPMWLDRNESTTAKTVAADYPGLGYDSGLRSHEAGHRARHPFLPWLRYHPFDQTSHTYADSRSTGTSTVDAVRAAQQVEAELAGLDEPSGDVGTNEKFAVFGSSQGGAAALATGQVMSTSYGDGLDLVAVLAGAPGSNLGTVTTTGSTEPLVQGIFAAGMVGASVLDPNVRPTQLFTDVGKANYERTSEQICSGTGSLESYLWWVNALYSYPFTEPLEQLLARPEVSRWAARQDVGNQVIDAPILIGQVDGDPIVDIERTDLLFEQFRTLDAQPGNDLDVTYCVFEGNGSTGVSLSAFDNHSMVKERMFTGDAQRCTDLDGNVTTAPMPAGEFLREAGISGF